MSSFPLLEMDWIDFFNGKVVIITGSILFHPNFLSFYQVLPLELVERRRFDWERGGGSDSRRPPLSKGDPIEVRLTRGLNTSHAGSQEWATWSTNCRGRYAHSERTYLPVDDLWSRFQLTRVQWPKQVKINLQSKWLVISFRVNAVLFEYVRDNFSNIFIQTRHRPH